MRATKVLLILIFTLYFHQISFFSPPASRIKGIVVDEETGQPIKNTQVLLLDCTHTTFVKDYFFIKSFVDTDDKGYFKFDDLLKGEYSISIFKSGYAHYGPVRYERVYSESPYSMTNDTLIHKDCVEDKFYLKEGQIKHLKIKLVKESFLEVIVQRKTISGISAVEKNECAISAVLDLKKECQMYSLLPGSIFTGSGGVYRLGGFKGNTALRVDVLGNGYKPQKYDVVLEKGKKTTINYLMDFTVGQVVYGVIRDKQTGEPLEGVSLSISNLDQNFSRDTETNGKGEFWLGALAPGKHSLFISYYRKNINIFKDFQIKINDKIEFNKGF